MDSLLSELLKLGTVGVITGLFSAFISNQTHQYKIWWELKLNAYQTTIEALSDLGYCINLALSNIYKYVEEGKASMSDESYDIWRKSYQQVRKSVDSSSFLFSKEAELVLKEFSNKIKECENIDEDDHGAKYLFELECLSGKPEECLKELVKCSKKDLHLNKFIKKILFWM